MMNIFRRLFARETVDDKTKDSDTQTEAASSNEPNETTDEFFKEVIYHYESAFRNQAIHAERGTSASPMKLGDLLQLLNGQLHTNRGDIAGVSIALRQEAKSGWRIRTTTSADEAWATDVAALAFETDSSGHFEKPAEHSDAMIVCEKCNGTSILINVKAATIVTSCLAYARVGILSTDKNNPFATNMIICTATDDADEALRDYEIAEQRTYEKVRKRATLDKLECEILHGRFEFQTDYSAAAEWHMSEKRIYDAYNCLTRALVAARHDIRKKGSTSEMEFALLSGRLADCMAAMGRHTEAIYYDRVWDTSKRVSAARSLHSVASMACLGDRRALHTVKNILSTTPGMEPDQADNMVSRIATMMKEHHMEWLKARESEPDTDGSVTIGYALSTLLNIGRRNVMADMVVKSAAGCEIVTSGDDIWATRLNGTTEAKTYVLHISHAHYLTEDPRDNSILCVGTNIAINVMPYTTDGDGHKAMRVSIMQANFSRDDDKRDRDSANTPVTAQFTMGETVADRFGTGKEDVLRSVEVAGRLQSEGRALEALKLMEWAYGVICAQQKDDDGLYDDRGDETLNGMQDDVCFGIGMCLMELRLEAKAHYYLSQVKERARSFMQLTEYVNCVTNAKDPCALSEIEGLLAALDKVESNAAVIEMRRFLYRRRTFVLIGEGRLAEAELRLADLLSNPEQTKFAETELDTLRLLMK